ncbi:MAG TPA: tyrosine-protein phosphatase [Chloroflexota bacterium]|nr:tyrosine-protein phosphatase [Chloroflexota bacterium]
MLLWEACRNVRDLGGYRTPAGRTRWGALVRADSLGQLTPAGQSSLIAYGICTVIDIRFPEEAARDPNPFADQSGGADAPAYLNIPVNSGRNPAMDAALMAARGSAVSMSREEANKPSNLANITNDASAQAAVRSADPGLN